MYIYHHDNKSTEILFHNNTTVEQLVCDLNNALESKGVNLDYDKTGHYEEGKKFAIAPVRVAGNKIIGFTVFRHWHAKWMSISGNRVSTDSKDFWDFVNEYDLMPIFKRYIPEADLTAYVSNIMAPTLDGCISKIEVVMRNIRVAHAPNKRNWIQYVIDPNTTELQPTIFNHGTGNYDKFEDEVDRIKSAIAALFPTGLQIRRLSGCIEITQ